MAKVVGYECRNCFEEFKSRDSIDTHRVSMEHRRMANLIIQCSCGQSVVCSDSTNTCSCGLDYNWSGVGLAPRSQWGEETGEFLSDIL